MPPVIGFEGSILPFRIRYPDIGWFRPYAAQVADGGTCTLGWYKAVDERRYAAAAQGPQIRIPDWDGGSP